MFLTSTVAYGPYGPEFREQGVSTGLLTIDLDAVLENWRALDSKSAGGVETAAVVKADGYGLGAGQVAGYLARNGVRSFFVAAAEEGVAVRQAVGTEADIYVFSGCMDGVLPIIRNHNLIPLLNSPEQAREFLSTNVGAPFGVQLDTGMNRLGIEPRDFAMMREPIERRGPKLVISHLACSDEPGHPQNINQLQCFNEVTDGLDAPRSLAATGGLLLGSDYHFDLCRPGVGLYGGLPFAEGKPVVHLDIPVVQTRDVAVGETVGYAAYWVADRPSKIATLAAGYADGLIRAMGNGSVQLMSDGVACPLIGRVSMDLLTVDVTDLASVPASLQLLTGTQGVDDLANAAGTIGYEILTSLGARYKRHYIGG